MTAPDGTPPAAILLLSGKYRLELYGQPSVMPAGPDGTVRISLGSVIPGIDAPLTYETGSIELADDLVAVIQAARDRAAGLGVSR